jgi:predicted TIM-barrel fold metal-dependent hydrolase
MAVVTRRRFLGSAAAIGFASRLNGQEPRAPVVDTHLHCFAGKDDKRFPYHPDGPYQPDEVAGPEHLLRLMAAAGVDYAVVVHPEPYQDDHRYLEHCLAVGKGKLKGTCLFFAGRPDTDKRMRELAKTVPVVAARVHAYNPDRLPPFGKPELRDLWKLAGDLGLAVQLHFEPRYAPGFEPYVKEFKAVRVLIDHLGRPFQGTEKEYAVVVGWAKYDNVVMKLSSVPEKRTYPHRDPAAVVKELADAFGADRLMYGGGYGAKATGESYRAERERTAGMLAHLSAADRAKALGGTAARLFGFGKG